MSFPFLIPSVPAALPLMGGAAFSHSHGSSIMEGDIMSGLEIAASGALNMAALIEFLKAAFPHSTAKQVGYLCGIPASSVEKWLHGETRPSGAHLCALIGVFGLPLLRAILPQAAWLREAAQHDEEIEAAKRLLTLIKGGKAQNHRSQTARQKRRYG